eukprot:m.65164 g.65164  ORF g.65164 m.65164 type:complete len:185 (-) comp12049_c0_seq1:3528-4082(-)
MTWMAALNCFALAFGPTMAVYHAAQLGEYSAGLACSRAAFLNILTQFFKMFILVSVLSARFLEENFWVQPLATGILYCMDIGVMYYFLSQKTLSCESYIKVLIGGIGWSLGFAISSLLFPIIASRKDAELDTTLIFKSAMSTPVLGLCLLTSYAVFAWMKAKDDRRPVATAALAGLCVLAPLVI